MKFLLLILTVGNVKTWKVQVVVQALVGASDLPGCTNGTEDSTQHQMKSHLDKDI